MALEWKKSTYYVPYEEAVSFMEERVALIKQGQASECIWLLEHPPLYTAGTSAREEDLLSDQFPVFKTGRGGEFTYHGPGQRVIYVMLDLERRDKKDLRQFIVNLEQWVIDTLATFKLETVRRTGRVGLWVPGEIKDDKIAAIGVRVRKWVTYHGISINVNPDLTHFEGIVPCGIAHHGVTSLACYDDRITMEQLDDALQSKFDSIF